jgi:thymidylate kinase
MHVELTGCTSSGKSTLIKRIIHSCEDKGVIALTDDQFVLEQVKLNWIKNYFTRTILVDLITLTTCLLTIRSNLKIYGFIIEHVRKLPSSVGILEKLNIIRNSLKKLGSVEIIKQRDSDKYIIFLDEGIVHTSHYLFVNQTTKPSKRSVLNYLNLIPYPDAIISLKADEEVVIERTLMRRHRRIKNPTYLTVKKFISNAISLFSIIEHNSGIRERLITIEKNGDIKNASSLKENGPLMITLNILHSTIYNQSKIKKKNDYAKISTEKYRLQSG